VLRADGEDFPDHPRCAESLDEVHGYGGVWVVVIGDRCAPLELGQGIPGVAQGRLDLAVPLSSDCLVLNPSYAAGKLCLTHALSLPHDGYGIVIVMAPKREGTPITVRLSDEVIAAIDKRRATTGQSRAEAIRKMLAWALAQPKR